MQSGYGGVSEIQQFMVDSCGSSLFSMSTANPNPAAAAGAAAATPTNIHSAALHPLKYHPLPQPHHPQPLPPPPLPPHFSHFHSIPITQQLFHQTTHPFQLFHPQQHYLEPRRFIPQHHLGLDQESAPETSPSPTRIIPGSSGGGGPSFLSASMSFKLAVNESSGGGSPQGMNDDDGILQGDDASESRLHHWQREDDESAIKELSWRPLDIDYISRNNKRCKDEEPAASNGRYTKKSKEVAGSDHVQVAGGGGSSNYKIFSELEAICKPGGSSTNRGGGTNRTGSGSALTGDETPLLHVTPTAPVGLPAADRVGGSETSAGEEATAQEFSKGNGRRRRKRWQRQLSSVATFFESLVKQLMDHQEGLHGKFLEVMERREKERTSREDARRKQEAAKSSREAAARAQERALASSREAAIISFIEKITGESLNLPSKPQFPSLTPDADDANKEDNTTDTDNRQIEPCSDTFNNGDPDSNKVFPSTRRWPKPEVQALIRVRSGLESRFQEPGLKGPLWEEVSAAMATMGYHRSAKRCKEKWENINKYFRKTKERGKKRPQHSKTCPYFHQLDQLYSKSHNHTPNPSTSSPNADVATANASGGSDDRRKDNSDLLDAIMAPNDGHGFKFSDMATLGFDFSSKGDESDQATAAKGSLVSHPEHDDGEEEDDDDQGGGGGGGGGGEQYEEEEEDEEEEEEEEEGGEGQGQGQENLCRPRLPLDQDEDELHDSSVFFQRLQS
ncbi:unnamed protein product [Musa acuminata subsp. malaccensis]|uniref:(wild Malaysian banana) hypothetical protein n=1 Tax=Musa acuminata subsp. malaccensis TaxID=214687 RepID=A0A804IBS7_MUSAM|nr:PREDICTED: trihelix transcription factor GTL1-like [Musa acuminata subsp. malaccensis]CAG1850084.1 unnamed protein product [Musa acuminata subsp. malaccensis]